MCLSFEQQKSQQYRIDQRRTDEAGLERMKQEQRLKVISYISQVIITTKYSAINLAY